MGNKPKDMELWHRVARSAKPLKGRDSREAHSSARQHSVRETGEQAPSTRPTSSGPRSLPLASARQAVPSRQRTPCLAHGHIAGVDRRTAERLKRGRLNIDARLDLHGQTQAEAHRALNAFIAASFEAGRRCLLIITGKGHRHEDGGVLRGKVPQWLNQSPNRGRVLAFDYAQPRDGGTGALYVMLRRKRWGG